MAQHAKLNELFFSLFQLQEAFARGELKPGLNIELSNDGVRKGVNNIVSLINSSSPDSGFVKINLFF